VSISSDSPEAPYRQLYGILRGQIERGEIKGKMPSLTRLMQEYGLAKNTVRRAVALLAEDGLVHGTPGWGTFVNEPQK
jgi:GntR family transcriptional regulator